jgi:hypothetical protein
MKGAGNPTKHVLVALALSALLFVLAGDKLHLKTIVPVQPAQKA